MKEERQKPEALLAALSALIIQLGLLFFVFQPSVFFYKYWELALRLRGVVSPPLPVFYSSPFYISFLAAFQGLGLSYLNIQIIQILLGALNCGLIYQAGLVYFNRTVARLASLAALLYAPFLIYNVSFLPAVWVITFNLLVLILLESYRRRPRGFCLIGAGVFIGLSIITRPTFALFLLFLLVYRAGRRRRRTIIRSVAPKARPEMNPIGAATTSSWKYSIFLIIPVLIVIFPVGYFNYAHSGEFIPVTASGGWVFFCSNNERTRGFDFSPPPEFHGYLGAYYARPGVHLNYLEHLLSVKLAEQEVGHRLSNKQASVYWFKRGRQFIRENTRAYLLLLGKKLRAAVNGYEGHDVPEVLEKARLIEGYPFLSLGVILPLALLGIIICRSHPGGEILRLFLLSYLLSFLIMYVIPRFRLPLTPVLLLYAAAAGQKLVRTGREKRWYVLGRNLLLLSALIFLVNFTPAELKRDRDVSRPAFLYEWRGLTALKQGKRREAGEYFHRALDLNPRSSLSRAALSSLKTKQE